MAYEFKLPDLGEGLTEGEVARWLVSEGQEIAEEDPLVEIATDKTTVEIPSPASGTVTQILVQEGAVVPVGTLLVVIGGDGEVSGTAIECPLERAQLTLTVRDDLELRMPVARTADAWVAFGFDEDLDLAADVCLATMLDLMERELGVDRKHALALASVAVDLHVTQIVNVAKGVHAVLRDGAVGR